MVSFSTNKRRPFTAQTNRMLDISTFSKQISQMFHSLAMSIDSWSWMSYTAHMNRRLAMFSFIVHINRVIFVAALDCPRHKAGNLCLLTCQERTHTYTRTHTCVHTDTHIYIHVHTCISIFIGPVTNYTREND